MSTYFKNARSIVAYRVHTFTERVRRIIRTQTWIVLPKPATLAAQGHEISLLSLDDLAA